MMDDTLSVPTVLRSLDFSDKDMEQDSNSAYIYSVVYSETALTGSQASDLLDLILFSDAGETERVAYHSEVTDEILTLGLPDDVVNMVPLTGVPENSFTGGVPRSWLDKLGEAVANVVVSVVEFLVNGLIALGNFLADLAETVAEIGLAVLGAIADALGNIAAAVMAAVEAMIEFLNIIIKFLVDLVKNALLGAFEFLKSTVSNYITSMGNMVLREFQKAIDAANSPVDIDALALILGGIIFGSALVTLIITAMVVFGLVEKLVGGVLPGSNYIIAGFVLAMIPLVLVAIFGTIKIRELRSENDKDGAENAISNEFEGFFNLGGGVTFAVADLIIAISTFLAAKSLLHIPPAALAFAFSMISFILIIASQTLAHTIEQKVMILAWSLGLGAAGLVTGVVGLILGFIKFSPITGALGFSAGIYSFSSAYWELDVLI
jgi:hypothetical protein